MWSICNEVTGKGKKSNRSFPEGDPNKLADQYNQNFLSIVPNLLNMLDTN